MIPRSATLVVTRPAGDAGRLIDALRARGRDVVAYPVIAIEPVTDPSTLIATMDRLADYRLVVFVSPNAIRQALVHRREAWPRGVTIGVMGPGSVATLAACGIDAPGYDVVAPTAKTAATGEPAADRFDSESLFAALDERLQLSQGFDGRVLIVRGNGGRAWFADRLRGIGVALDEVEGYRRLRPAADPVALASLYASGTSAAFIVTSSEGVDHLVAMVPESLQGQVEAATARTWLLASTMLVPHVRIAEKARRSGFSDVRVCAPGDRGILAAIE